MATTDTIPPVMTKAVEAATVRKLNAEAEKLSAEAGTASAFERFHAAGADKLAAEARQQLALASANEMGLVHLKEVELARVNSDAHHHVYQFNGPVTSGSVGQCSAQLRQWDRIDPTCDIEIIFNSPGGGVIEGMALFDLIARMSLRNKGTHKMTVGAQGYAASMGGILLQSGDHRWIGAQSYLMIHEISAGTSGKIGEMQDSVKFYDAICDQVVDIFVLRSAGKITKRRFIESWKRIDWWLLAGEALKLGFADEIR